MSSLSLLKSRLRGNSSQIFCQFIILHVQRQGLTRKGSSVLFLSISPSPRIGMSEEQLSVCISLSSLLLLFMGRRSLLAGAAAPFSFSFSAAFPLGGASIIISENPDAFGVLECPHLYWARKLFNFVPCNLVMISRYDFIKAAMGLCS